MKLTNRFSKPIVLDDGTILAAAGTNGSTKEVESITDRDRRRYVQTMRVAIAREPEPEAQPKKVLATAAPEDAGPTTGKPTEDAGPKADPVRRRPTVVVSKEGI
jgi:hypothetical protein